ncbi:uncharacterized protein [Haliotis cracherodii]|uniref:uncharacterized protein isoform X2 n=1 Tax=Haliotis cracherodii TaxID=6455 RepID=UPI0039E7B770
MIKCYCYVNIVLYIITASQTACRACPPHTYLQKNNKCCREVYCQDDTYVKPCVEDNSKDICEACPQDYTLAYGSSSFNPRRCYQEPNDMPAQDEVVAVNATTYECNRTVGFIEHPSESRGQFGRIDCQLRSIVCGQGKEPLAGPECRKCPFGFFKEDHSDWGMCRAWRNCSMLGLVERTTGSDISDVICTELAEASTTAGPSTGRSTGRPKEPSTGPSTGPPTGPPTGPHTTTGAPPPHVTQWVILTAVPVSFVPVIVLTCFLCLYWKRCRQLRNCICKGSESQDAVEMEPLRRDVETPNGSLGSRRYIGTGPPSNTTEDTMLTVNTARQPSSRVEGSLITPGQLSGRDSSSHPHYTNGSILPHPNNQVDSEKSSSNTYPSGESSLTGVKEVSEPTVHMPEKKDVEPTVDETSPKLTGAQYGGDDLGADADKQTVRKLPFSNESSPKRWNSVHPRPALRLNTKSTDSTDKKKPVGIVSPMITPDPQPPPFSRMPGENSDNSSSNVSNFASSSGHSRPRQPPFARGNSSERPTQQAVVAPLLNEQPGRAVAWTAPAAERHREAAEEGLAGVQGTPDLRQPHFPTLSTDEHQT